MTAMLTLDYLSELLERNRPPAKVRVREFSIGGRHFAFNSKPAIMGVVNLSPDSWYRESVCLTTENAVRRGRVMQEQGADIVDIGAESTLAHATLTDEEGQKAKLLPVIKALSEAGLLVSAETYHLTVARACLEAGAKVLNLTGTDLSAELFRMVAAHDAAVILCYVQGKNAREVGDFDFSADPIADDAGVFCAVKSNKPPAAEWRELSWIRALGFYYRNLQDSAIRVRHQMTVFLNTFRLRTLGFPICHALPHAFEYFGEEVRSAEPFFAVLAALGKTDLFRTHEVPRIRAVLETMKVF